MKRKIIIAGIVFMLVISVAAIAAMALFSDTIIEIVSGKGGTVTVEQFGLTFRNADGTTVEEIPNWNPGDITQIEWALRNKGNKSADTRHNVHVYWNTDPDIHESGTIYLYPASWTDTQIYADIDSGAANALTSDDMVETKNGDGTKRYGYCLQFYGSALEGIGDAPENSAADSEIKGSNKNPATPGGANLKQEDYLAVKLVFDPHATAALMGKAFEVKIVSEAKQFRNSAASDWAMVS